MKPKTEPLEVELLTEDAPTASELAALLADLRDAHPCENEEP